MLTMGMHRFEIYLDGALVADRSGYLAAFERVVSSVVGDRVIEIRCINKLTGKKKSQFYNFTVPQGGEYRLDVDVSRAWGGWKQPILISE